MSNRNIHYLKTLQSQPLGTLGKVSEASIQQNQPAIKFLLEKQSQQKRYKEGETLTFDDIDRMYNSNLSFEEKQAWVWFKRSQGVPMTGWEKYFLKAEKQKNTDKVRIVTNKQTTVKDNHFRDITSVPKGVELGFPTKFENNYDKVTYLVFSTFEGYKQYVNKADVDFLGEGQERNDFLGEQVKQLVRKGALFFSNGLYLPYAFFVFGNLYDRELTLKNDEDFIKQTFGEEVFNNHVEVIQKAKPKFLSLQVADPRERPIILAISPLAKDKNLFSISEFREDSGIDLQAAIKKITWKSHSNFSYSERVKLWTSWEQTSTSTFYLPLREAFKFWLHEQPEDSFKEVSAYYIEKYYLDRDKFSTKVSDEEKDTINKYAPQVGEELFAKFLNEALTFEDIQRLDFLFNRTYNGNADIAYHKVPIGFACSAYFKQGLLSFSEAQKESIAFMEVASAGILAYDVGVGKTMSAIITLANAIQQGKCKRPLIVVPNQTYRKWIKELFGYENKKTGEKGYGVLSGTGITLNDFYNLGKEVVSLVQGKGRNYFKADGKDLNTLLPEKSISIVTYEGFKKLGIGKGLDESFEEMYSILEQNDGFKTIRDQAKYEESLSEALNKVNKGSIVDFNVLGIDYVVIDEAHACKNIFEAVKADEEGKVRYQLGSASSETGIKAFFFCNSIIRKYGGNVLLLTATPFTNSPVEIYAMLSLVGYKTMKDMRLSNLNSFMCSFVKQSLEYVNKVDGSIALDYVVKAYTNRQVLQKLIYSHILYKTGEDAGVKRPIKINLPRLKRLEPDGRIIPLKKEEQILTYLEPNAVQKENQALIEARLTSATNLIGTKDSGVTLGDIGRLLNQNLDNALSPYLLEGDMPDPNSFVKGSPKIDYVMECIRSVKKWHEERKQECSGQVIYCNRGKQYFGLMQRYLNSNLGFKSEVKFDGATFNQVEIITSGISQNRKEKIKEAFLAGIVKVLIGTASIREGIDLQKRGTCLYILTPDWNPTDIKQVEGRIYRQGNDFAYVRIVTPLCQDSMDIFVFQKLEEKTSRVNDIWYKAGRGNVLDQEALDPEEIKLALFSKIDVLVALRLDLLTKELNRKISVNKSSMEALETFKARYSNYLATRDNVLKFIEIEKKALIEYLPQLYKKKDFEGSDKKKIGDYIEKTTELINDLDNYLISSSQDDKDLLKLCRRLESLNLLFNKLRDYSTFNRRVDDLKVLISFVRKTERALLIPRGYAPNDSERLIAELKEESRAYGERLKFLETSKGKDEVRKEIEEAKEKYSVQGKTAKERAEEFANLNYLLQYGANDDVSDVMKPESQNQASEKELSQKQRIRVALALAKARARMRDRNQS